MEHLLKQSCQIQENVNILNKKANIDYNLYLAFSIRDSQQCAKHPTHSRHAHRAIEVQTSKPNA
jgi:hypothetical protein